MRFVLAALCCLFTAALLLLLLPARLHVRASLHFARNAAAELRVRLLFGMIQIRRTYIFHLLEEPAMTLMLKRRRGDAVLWAPGRAKKPGGKANWPGLSTLIRHVRIAGLTLTGELGVREDACLAALGAGGLMSGACMSVPLLLKYTDNRRPPDPLKVWITPRADADCLRLNLTGIAECHPIHIISAIVLWEWNNRKGKKAAWRILSKTS